MKFQCDTGSPNGICYESVLYINAQCYLLFDAYIFIADKEQKPVLHARMPFLNSYITISYSSVKLTRGLSNGPMEQLLLLKPTTKTKTTKTG